MGRALGSGLGTALGDRTGDDLTLVNLRAGLLAISPYSIRATDYYSVDGVTGKVAALLDAVNAGTGIKAIIPAHAVLQSTSAKQCALPAADSSFGNARSMRFAAAPYYVSNAPPSAWQFEHNGTGVDVFHIFKPLSLSAGNRVLESTALSASAVQCFLLFTSTASLATNIYGGATGSTLLITQNAGTLVVNTATYVEQSYVEGGTADLPFEMNRFVKATSVQAQNSAAAPYLVDSNNTLTIGAMGGGTLLANMDWCERICFNRVLSAAHRTVVRDYITAKYGIT